MLRRFLVARAQKTIEKIKFEEEKKIKERQRDWDHPLTSQIVLSPLLAALPVFQQREQYWKATYVAWQLTSRKDKWNSAELQFHQGNSKACEIKDCCFAIRLISITSTLMQLTWFTSASEYLVWPLHCVAFYPSIQIDDAHRLMPLLSSTEFQLMSCCQCYHIHYSHRVDGRRALFCSTRSKWRISRCQIESRPYPQASKQKVILRTLLFLPVHFNFTNSFHTIGATVCAQESTKNPSPSFVSKHLAHLLALPAQN